VSRWLVLVLVLVAAVGVAVAVVLLAGRPSDRPRVAAPPLASLAPDARTGPELAAAACLRLRRAAQGIRAGGDAETVRGELAAARVLAAEAVRRDGRFAALSGGAAALDEAVRRDDGPAAVVGLRVALEECG
jgi:hypothetical protein